MSTKVKTDDWKIRIERSRNSDFQILIFMVNKRLENNEF